MRYLNPRADLTFKKVFGEHPDLVISLLNALLPLEEGQEVEEVEYLPAEMVPDNPLRKDSIVDVRCKDRRGRQFLVEMQTIWSPEFQFRVLFNASKAYVRQLKSGMDYKLLQPVYSLNLVNAVFETELEGYYHYYRLVHEQHTERIIDGLHLVFVELPKFQPHTYSEKRMHVLWMRFLTEIDENTRTAPPELLADPQVRRALEVVEESAYTDAQMYAYDRFWDSVSVETTLMNSRMRLGQAEGRAQGLAQGIEMGRAKGMAEGIEQGRTAMQWDIARKMKAAGMANDLIARTTGLAIADIESL